MDDKNTGGFSQSVPGKTKKKKTFMLISAGLILIAALVWFYDTFLYGYISVDDAYIDRDKASVSSKILGRIVKINVEEGNSVKKDQALVELDPSELLAQQKQAEASLEYAKENVKLAKLALDKNKEDFGRMAALHKEKVIAEQDYSHSKNTYETSEVAYKNAINQVDVYNAQLELIKTSLKNTVIAASFAGVVSKKWVLEGDIVQAGQPILSINNSDTLWVTANVEETNLAHLRTGDDVSVTVDSFRGMIFKGRISQIGSSTASQFSLIPANNASGNFTKITQRVPVKILLDPVKGFDPGRFLPGMSVVVKFRKRG